VFVLLGKIVERGWCSFIGVAVLGVEPADVGEDAVDDARDIDVGFEAARDAQPMPAT
jgi:hypothetical protein